MTQDIAARSGTRIDHIGIIVPDYEKGIALFQAILGVAPVRKELKEFGLKIAEFQAENVGIELLHYEGDAAFARKSMGNVPGFNHIALEVSDVAAAAGALVRTGLKAQPGFPRRGAHGEVLFLEREPENNLLIELCKPD